MLFDDGSKKKNDSVSIESPIKQHIRQIDENLKHRYRSEKKIKIKKSKKEIEKQLKRMNFMGIPISNADATRCAIKSIVEQMSIEKTTSKERVITMADGSVKFMPRVPFFHNEREDECKETKSTASRFSKAEPRGNDPRLLRIDKSYPWIQFDVADTKKKSENSENQKEKNLIVQNVELHEKISVVKNAQEENCSAIKKTFSDIIASKLQNQNTDLTDSKDIENLDRESKTQSIASALTLSSEGTYFSNDSGSYLMFTDEKIPKSQLNIARKFQV